MEFGVWIPRTMMNFDLGWDGMVLSEGNLKPSFSICWLI